MAYSNVITVGDQVIRGVKTFTDAPVFSSGVTDSTIVRTTGDQTIAGVKTFSEQTNVSYGFLYSSATTKYHCAILFNITAARSIPDTTPTPISFTANRSNVISDTLNFTISGTQITIVNSGHYLFSAKGSFDANSTGIRRISLKIDGNIVASSVVNALVSGTTPVCLSMLVYIDANSYVELEAVQTSTISLNLGSSAIENRISVSLVRI